MKGKVVFFATHNIHKFNEARSILSPYGIAVGMIKVKALEIQSDSLSEIATASVTDTFNRCHLPVIVEDAGLFIDALKGFPGPYAAYVYKTIGNKGLLKLMENVNDRKATFQSAIAFYNGQSAPMCFEGEVTGEIAFEERLGSGNSGFGFDPVFQPVGSFKVFAEMTIEEKNRFSHRASAFRKFAEWYKR
ncbi:XTP/dITP diphosphatase [Candidatus Bathyarchaeota archaeon A05DMB-2]|nr:XTP/dITP diphosphatase [Candidatus Bathyarchaeota archaeon A05DMB-2]